ncbi:MAG: hypothetical protein Q9162_006606 [Coniocarpon cinnabarinum]
MDSEKFGQRHKEYYDVGLSQTDSGEYIPSSEEEEKRVIRKLDFRLIPFVFVLYSLSVLDRSNLGNAKLAGLTKDIDLEGNRYNWLGTVFYIAYILFQWTTIGWKQFKAHQWATFCVFFWGFVATIQATVTSWGGLMTCRFFLGVAESMYGPGVPLYLSYFYPKEKVGFRHGMFIAGSAMANVYGGALAYGITQIRGSVAPWKILFIIEGAPTCLVAAFAWVFLPDSISATRFFTDREKEVATRMVAKHQTVDEGQSKQGLRLGEFLDGFRDPKSYIPALMYFSVNVSFASLPLFVPTIIDEMGSFSTIQAQGLSAPPYALVLFAIIIVSFVSDRVKMRGPFICVASLVAAVGFIMLATTSLTAPRFVGVFLAVEIFVCVSLLLSWTANIHASESKRTAGYIILSTIGQCGPVLGTNVFPSTEKPYYRKGMWISCAFCLLVSVLSVTLSLWLIKENRDMEKAGLLDDDDPGEIKDSTNQLTIEESLTPGLWAYLLCQARNMSAVYKSLSKRSRSNASTTVKGDLSDAEKQTRQRVLILSSRGVTYRHRHLLNDLYALLPHSRKDAKLDTKTKLYQLNELADLYNCNNVFFFEARKGKDLYVWMSKAPNGPTVKFHLQNLHTMEELNFTGNCLKGSRPILSFDATFDTQPQLQVIKELLLHVFGVPKTSRKIKPFVDHVIGFTIADGRVWTRCYQINEMEPSKTSDAHGDAASGKETVNSVVTRSSTGVSLVEIGPRFVMTPIVILESSFGGPVLFENKEFVSPNQVRADMRRARAGKRNFRTDQNLESKFKRGELGLKSDGKRKARDPLDDKILFK